MDKRTLSILGNRIKQLRLNAGLSQEDLAELSTLHRNYIGALERGEKNPTLITLKKISKAFGISLSKLFENID